MAPKAYLSTSTFHVRPGKEQEFTKLWQDNVSKIAQRAGCTRPGIYCKPGTSIFMTTGHWSSEQAFNNFFNSPEAKPIIEKALSLCSKNTPDRTCFEVIQEKAA